VIAALSLATAATTSSASAGDKIAFWIVAPIAVLGAVMMLASRKAVHAALWLALTMCMLAILYIMQGAVFLGVVQVVVYTGAVMMLFLFVLMLVGVDASDSKVETLRGQRAAALVAGLGFGVLIIGAVGRASTGHAVGVDTVNAADGGNISALARLIFTRYVWAFEVTSALLITAAVGAMVLAHRERVFRRKTQRELSEQRVLSGAPTPLAAPGVYARHNAVDVPGLLPDGTPSSVSVPSALGELSGQAPVPLLTGTSRDELAARQQSSATKKSGDES
jgi:NADH-quinone oxidoreductase subunit J